MKTRILLAALMIPLVIVLAGCGDDTGLPKRYPVTGQVTYNGTPVEKGTITFKPKDPASRAATGEIKGGFYELTTAIPGDGAIPGEYFVTMSARAPDTSEVEKFMQETGGSPKQDDVGEAYAKAEMLIPAKYEIPSTSGLERTVEAQSNKFDFELTD